jgi:hypothetical protein
MNAAEVARFEAQAAETVGAMKELFTEFERRLGEVVAAQRLVASEARDEGIKARAALETIARQARFLTEAQRQAIEELRGGWQMHVAENSKAAGAEMARSFGREIAAGIEQRLVNLGDAVDRVTRRFQWVTALKWGAALALATALTIALGVWALIPSVDGLTMLQVREAMAQLAPCHIGQEPHQEPHVCIMFDDKPHISAGVHGEGLVVVHGM